MKKMITAAGITALFICLFAFAFLPEPAKGVTGNAGDNPVLPDSVLSIVNKSCMDCHGDDGSGMAKSKVNFSKWATYDAKKQASKAEDISKEVSKGKMPPGKWRKNNPDNIPDTNDARILSNWAKALNSK